MRQLPQRVVWSEGMLLSPQHFQAQDAYHEAMLEARVAAVTPRAWGVASLELDSRALSEGRVALGSFRGVLPSGSVIVFSEGDAETPPARSLAELPVQHEPLDVYLALPLERLGTVAYARSGSERAHARYVVEARRIADRGAPGDEISVELARRAPRIVLGGEPQDDLEAIKVAEIVRDAAGSHAFCPSYVPPCLRLSAAPQLVAELERLLVRASSEQRAARAALRHRSLTAEPLSLGDVARQLLLHAVGGSLPLLAHLVSDPDATPHQAYLVLARLVGQLNASSPDADSGALPQYAHADLRTTFEPLLRRATELLGRVSRGAPISVVLDARVDGMHLGRLDEPGSLRGCEHFMLAVESALPERTVQDLLPRVGKVASWTEIPRYVSAALSAVPLVACERPPRHVAAAPGKLYFGLDASCPIWRSALAEGTVAVHLPPPFAPATTTVELIAIPGGAA